MKCPTDRGATTTAQAWAKRAPARHVLAVEIEHIRHSRVLRAPWLGIDADFRTPARGAASVPGPNPRPPNFDQFWDRALGRTRGHGSPELTPHPSKARLPTISISGSQA